MNVSLDEFRRCRARAATLLAGASVVLGGCLANPRPAPPPRTAEERLERPPASTVDASPTTPVESRRPNATPFPPAPPQPLSALARRGNSPVEVVEVVDDLRFPPGTPALAAVARARLDALAARLRRAREPCWIEVQGHADASGDDATNLFLALQRAETVRSYLVRIGGVAKDRTAVVSLGASRPVADNATAEGRARNRRVVVLVLR